MQARVASYNIRKSVGLDYRRDPRRVLDVLAGLDADVIALQEVDRRFGERISSLPPALIAEHTELQVVDLAARPGSIGWHGNAILVRRGTEVLRQETINLPGLEPRGAVLADLLIRGKPLRVVGVHLALFKRHRREQISHLARHLEGLAPSPTVVLGDYNEWSKTGRNLTAFSSGFAVHSPGQSFPTSRPIAGLDRIAISHDLALANKGVHSCESARRASDHLPIWADLVAA